MGLVVVCVCVWEGGGVLLPAGLLLLPVLHGLLLPFWAAVVAVAIACLFFTARGIASRAAARSHALATHSCCRAWRVLRPHAAAASQLLPPQVPVPQRAGQAAEDQWPGTAAGGCRHAGARRAGVTGGLLGWDQGQAALGAAGLADMCGTNIWLLPCCLAPAGLPAAPCKQAGKLLGS